ncbi:hypothetical protein B0H11DRAFT_1925889 [Mycena galericulata]|nr:hypothetical protein B0H11DRAFT_1925889 [Mycena galericulata]
MGSESPPATMGRRTPAVDSGSEGRRTPAADSNSALGRNQACYNCRRPVCGQCLSTYRRDDCEYPDKQGRSRAEILEEDISRVQYRIYQLEHPQEAHSSVQLHHPYRQINPAQMPGLYQILDAPSPVPSPGPVLSAPPNVFIKSPASTSDSWWTADEPPMHMVENLLDTFLPYADDWGFFLDAARFKAAALLPLPPGHHARPTPALLAAVYLAAIALSPSPALKTHEKPVLARALAALPASLAGLHPARALHALQAELLLARYFFGAGKSLEGGYHTAAAVSLAVAGGLHTVRREGPGRGTAAEWAERVGACWATATLDKTWAVALGTQPNWNDAIDTPWPEDDDAEGSEPSTPTVATFTARTEVPASRVSPKTVLAKAAILWQQANTLTASWKPEMSREDARKFSPAFDELDSRISDFRRAVGRLPAQSPRNRTLVVGCSIAHAAALTLHLPLAPTHARSKARCIAAATALLEVVAHADLALADAPVYIDPILAPVWGLAARVAVDALRETRQGREGPLAAVFERALAVMRPFAGSSRLIRCYVDKIQAAYDAV